MLDAMDYVQIQNVINLYPHIIDIPENYHRAGEVFAEDGVFDSGLYGRHEGVAALVEYWSHSPTRAEAFIKTNILAHNAANIVITEDPDGTVRCESRCIGVSQDGRASVMIYHDIMRKTEKGWRIAHRKLLPMKPPTVTLRAAS
jgi:hypothetical protein